MKRATLMAIIPLVLLAPWPRSETAWSHPGQAWHPCAGDSGGAFATRVLGLSCREGRSITESGLTADARSTRRDHLTCTRRRDGQLWAYGCASADGRRQLRFSTF